MRTSFNGDFIISRLSHPYIFCFRTLILFF
jgi:hypothetical protein